MNMDRLSFVFSLLLLVSVTTITFGSVIKAKNPNGESLVETRSDPDLFLNMVPKDLEALLKRSHHQSNPHMKTDAEAKLQEQNGEDEGSEMFERHVTLLPTKDFQIGICVENKSGKQWMRTDGQYIVENSTQPALRDSIDAGDSALASSYGEQGVGGIFQYTIRGVESPLAVMYRVDNRHIAWYVMLNKDERPVDEDLYKDMFFNSYEAKEYWGIDKALSKSLMYRGRMSDFRLATLEIKIFPSDASNM